ncbi:hypothetical protein M1O15_01085 [Streptomyces lichenis]|uniref:Secreted protein n=1 Tax=Streptomyces lichenis TaxID=2306967 RepID=A0ABT0I3Z1_9ACTN|nr:hypothetical protein [Streptomyces lichenis]
MTEQWLPALGTTVRDTGRDRVGVVTGVERGYVWLRPLGGGRQWAVEPARVKALSTSEVLSAQLAEVNARSRQDLGAAPGCVPDPAPGPAPAPGDRPPA